MKTKELPKIQANKWKAGKPRIRRINGGWACYLPGTSPTFGYTMREAYNRWARIRGIYGHPEST